MTGDLRVVVGRVAGAFGVKGLMRIESWTQPFDNLRHYNPWFIRVNGAWHRRAVSHVSVSGQRLVAGLEGVADRDAAQLLYHADIAIARDQLEILPPGEYYWFELTGLRVVNLDGITLGVVDSLMETGANNILVVRPAEGKHECLIPYIKEQVVRNVDLDKGVVTVDWEESW